MRPRAITSRAAVTLAATLAVCSLAAARPDTPILDSIDSLLNAACYDTARTLTVAALHTAEARGDSALAGRLAFRLGRMSVTVGDQPIARRELDRAIRLTTAARDTANLAYALVFRGFVHRDMKEVDEAMACFARARDLAHRAHAPGPEAEAVYNLAYRDLRSGKLDAARPGYFRANELWRSTKNPYLMAAGANAMGNLYEVTANLDSARYWYNETLRLAHKRYPFYELWAYNNLGDMGRRLGNYEVAIDNYRRALAIGKRIRFERGVAVPSLNMALTYSYLGEHDLASQSLDECLAVCRRAGFKDMEVVNTITAGALHLEAGDNSRAALLFRRIVNMDFVFDANRRNEAAYGLSLALAEQDSVEQAISVLEPYVSPRATVANVMGQTWFELQYANLLRRAGRCHDALTRIHALQPELDGSSELGIMSRLMESSCRRQLGDLRGASSALTVALDSLEAARAQLGQPDVREAFGLHLMSDVTEGCRVLLEYPLAAPHPERTKSFYDALQRFKTRTLLERIRDPRGHNPLAPGRSVAYTVTASRLQKEVLRRGELLLDMMVSKDECFMFAITADSCRMVVLPGSRSELAEKAKLYTDLLSEPGSKARNAYPVERLLPTQRALGDAVLGPVADLVAAAHRVIFAPDGFYASIPLGTLVPAGNNMLLEAKEVMEVPSASVLEWARTRHPVPGHGTSLVVVTDESASGLEGARHEADQLRGRYAHVNLVAAREGVLDTLSRRVRPGSILHVAAHARVNDASPWHSGFMLAAAANASPGRDAPASAGSDTTFLRAWEIARATLPYEMAVLSGCETAAGRATNGEGVLGLTSAFLSAGVPVVVSSRWAVDDQVTADLMGYFYDGLARGANVATALRDAQASVRRNPATRHPFYWAGFSVVGDGTRVITPVRLAGRFAYWPSIYRFVFVVLGVAGWQIYRRRRGFAKVS